MMVHRGQSSLVTRPTPPVIVWMVLVAVLLALSLTADAALTLKVGSLSETSGPEQASYYSLGLSAAASVASSAALTYSVVPSSVGVSDGFSTIQAFSAAQVIGTLGPAGTDLLNSMCMNPSFATIEYVTFAPLVQGIDNTNGVDPTFLLYRTQVYFTIPSDQVQSVALLMLFAKRDLFPINQKLLRNSGSGIGGSPNLMLNIIATNMGVSYTFLSMNSFSTNAVVSFFGSNPKVIYFFGDATKTATSLWFSALCTSSNAITLNTSISFPMDIEYQFLQLYITEKTNGQKTLPVENFVVSVSHPGIDSTEYAVSHQFMEEAQDLLPANANTCILNYVMSGWLNARAFLASISQYAGSTVSPANYYKNLLQGQSSFVVSDLFVGSFGVNCSEVAVRQGAICGCHHGGNHVFFHQFVQRGAAYDVATIPNSMYQYALGMCANVIPTGDVLPATPFQTQLTYPSPIHVVGLNTPDNDMILYMCDQFQSVISQLENHTLYWHTSTHDYRAYCLKTTVSNAQTALQTHYADYITFGLMGVIPDALLTTSYVTGSLIVDVIPQTTRPALSEKNLIYICPTLEQELSVLASQVQQVSLESSVTVCGVVSQSTVSTSIISLLQALLTTMLVPVVSTNFVTSNTGAAMTASIKAGCTHTFLIGISSTDVTSTEAYLTANPKAFLYVSFDDLTKLYESFQAQYTSSNTVTDRLIFATNLPSWTSPAYSSTASVTNTAVSSIDQFLQTVPDKLHTPAAVRSFVSAMVMDAAMTQKTPTNSLPDAITALYSMSMVSAGGMMFGPFGQQCLTATDNACVQNYGARDISVWSFTRVLQPLTDVLLEPSTPSPFILSPASHSLAERGDEHASATTDMTGVAAADIDCIMRSESSGSQPNSQHADSTASSSSSAVPPVPLPTDHLSSSDASLQSSESTALDVLMYILAALCGLCVLLLVLLLVCRYCPLRCCCQWTCFTSLRRARTYPEVEERPETQSLADFGPEFSIVVIDVVRWKAEWSRNPVKMTDLVHAYETIVRAAVMHYGCFEAAHVCGFYTLLCPSPTVAVELAYHTHRCLEELRLPSVHDEAPSRLFRVGMHVLTHTATTSKEAGLSEAQMIALRVGYAGCGDSVMLSAAAFEALPQHLRDGLRVSEAGFYHADPGKPESSPTNRVFAVNVSGDVEGVASVLSCAYPAFVMKHDRECYFINSATLCEDQLGRFFIAVPILEQLITLKYSCHYFRVGSPARGGLSDTQLIRELTVILCQRLGSLLEYRHSICAPMSNIHRPGVAESRSLAQPEFDESGTSVRSIRRKQHQRYQSRHTLRHFSYQREAEE